MSENLQDVLDPTLAEKLVFNEVGLIPAIVQQYDSLEVLMMGWMDEVALQRTLTTGRVWFYSRSRREYWRKGDTSGNRQYVKKVAMDCDADVLLVTVDQVGVACHTGTRTCFTGRDIPALVGDAEADNAEGTK